MKLFANELVPVSVPQAPENEINCVGSLSLTQSCRQIRHEASDLFYSQSTFVLERVNVKDLISFVGRANTPLITSLQIHSNQIDALLETSSHLPHQKYGKHFTALKQLQVKGASGGGRKWVVWRLEQMLQLRFACPNLRVTTADDDAIGNDA